jgi:hypothetical protein
MKDVKALFISAGFLLVLLTVQSAASIQAQEEQTEELCSVGLSLLKSLIDEGDTSEPTINLYNKQLRTDVIAAYIEENIDSLAISDLMSTESGKCLIASSVAEQEQIQGTTFEEDDELDEAIALHSVKKEGEIAGRVLENESALG